MWVQMEGFMWQQEQRDEIQSGSDNNPHATSGNNYTTRLQVYDTAHSVCVILLKVLFMPETFGFI